MKKILIFLLVIFIVIQFFHPAKNQAMDNAAFAGDISTVYNVPDSVRQILTVSCYDCHSNNTNYPWYNNIQPVAWWLNHHVTQGKKELDFSEFASYPISRKYKKINAIIKEIKSDGMPLSSYTLIHRNAILSPEQKDLLINWATIISDSIKANTPADSLKKKK